MMQQHPERPQKRPHPQPNLLPSTSDFMIGPLIGEGTFGQVFYGQHKTSKKDVAIKIVEKVTCSKYPFVIQSLQTERNFLLHKHLHSSKFIVNLWASFVDKQCIYLVMELSNCGDLQNFIDYVFDSKSTTIRLLRKEAWNESIAYYAIQIIDAIQFIHSKHIVHCDLKPQNILCNSNGHLCLTDFACAFELSSVVEGDKSSILGSNNAVVIPRGTPNYACPEIIRSKSTTTTATATATTTSSSSFLTTAVDLWSLGCIIYSMYVGKSPFDRQSESLTIQAIMEYVSSFEEEGNNQSSCSSLDLSIASKENAEWENFICGLLHPIPDQRIQTFKDATTTTLTQSNDDDDNKNSDDSSQEKTQMPNLESILKKKPPLLPPKPPWYEQVRETKLKDGALGWGVFML